MPNESVSETRAYVLAGLGWLVPGLGYFLLRRWLRGALVLLTVGGMFWLGLKLQGQLYGIAVSDVLDVLGFVGDVCNGALYFVTRSLGGGVGNQSVVYGDYGTKFLIASGLLNLLAAADVRDIALGHKA
ncbi:MAG: DUF6677 family protein [Terriglobales bacterium]